MKVVLARKRIGAPDDTETRSVIIDTEENAAQSDFIRFFTRKWIPGGNCLFEDLDGYSAVLVCVDDKEICLTEVCGPIGSGRTSERIIKKGEEYIARYLSADGKEFVDLIFNEKERGGKERREY
ncbi:MAG: hypothetical protein UR39_C0007G0007 [Candidatus Woesebacteria bacterium GW2011_GWA1_33_30]|uniref:Uncharacterized protein n=1 Tax=Candidatus Woesebacteria bacterium GW2011_GWA2_33_28 TaxID=1618561 RepID=A0A0F9ZRQ7_9BACT|nr:MAG: hypothetical protein UR38_C0007G0007 [Candidatus Woesebacteria bacterium GW2011_GWA2_33_28]KKP47789.1 MAG: hypothetical protein UR39_C0007G0007 [Candidatus Woesebacteria bacterium GW2011_GWA1_33_30]KKP49234.1 MAG: hypothetical protein UR40_C0008G0007 [Microgenomates group bacterium GW2011_GWC1_33_32]KKP51601.1 MAG: hypothetical protein UR44_C0008G0003 [Candidatus Woesebacteria bacterium GW2011_GWB1_33_38]KKP56145.1 MAG: hypothetical protein UR48_C0039G0004 [Microgenomates group bacteriu